MSPLAPPKKRVVSWIGMVAVACGCCLSLRCDQLPGVEYPATLDKVLTVHSIKPTTGPVSGGTRMTIQGLEFAGGTAVFFGDVAASDIAVVNNTVITATTPPCPLGSVEVILRGPDGREAVSPVPFTYLETAEDSDGDGVSDAQESAGWTIAIDLFGFGADHPLALVYLEVFSDPYEPDTDGDNLSDYEEYVFGSDPSARDSDHDGLFDAEEIDRWWTSPVSVDTDGDADGPDGDLPPNPSLFDGAELKIDFANDPSHTPALDATSPTLPDTDADARTDYEEFDHPVRSPILANLPEVEVGLEDAVDIRLNVEYAEEIGKSREYGTATTTSQTRTESFSRSHMFGVEVGVKIGLELEASAGLFDWGGAKSSWEFSATTKTEHTYEYSTEDSVTNQEEYHQFQTDSRNYTEAVSSGSMSGGLRISNPGNIAYHLDNFGLTVRLWDRSFDPQTGTSVGEFKTLATLTPALADGVTLAPGDSTPVLQVSDDDVNPDVVKQFLAQPKTLHLETAYYDLETAQGLNFAFIEEETRALTAAVVIDFGDGNVERYYIAARVNRNPDATYTGVNLYDFLTQYLQIPITTTTVRLDGNGSTPASRLARVRGIPAGSPTSQAFWVVVGDNDDFFDDPSVGFTDIMLHGGDSVMLILTADDDDDGLNAYEEELYRTSEEEPDSDGDGLKDLLEARDQKQPDESVEEAGWMVRVEGQPAYRTYSDPSNADADGDGLSDLAERGGCAIDGQLDINITDETECTDPPNNGEWHDFQGEGCVFCAEDVEGCADIDNQNDCEAGEGTWVHLGTDPNRADTDDDGLADDFDPYPTLPAGRLHVFPPVADPEDPGYPGGDDNNDGLSWDNALATIGKAIDEWNTRNNDADEQNDVAETWVAQGNYKPADTIQLPSNLAMYGGFEGTETKLGQRPSAYGTVIDGTACVHRAFHTPGGTRNVLLDGLLIRNCNGGVMEVEDTLDLTLRNILFMQNSADQGGVLYMKDTNNNGSAGTVLVGDCTFANNMADVDGGAMHAEHAYLDFQNCLFQDNGVQNLEVIPGDDWCDKSHRGGALYLKACRTRIKDCRFTSNEVSAPTINVVNTEAVAGGAIFCSSNVYGSRRMYIENSVFKNNAVYDETAWQPLGGALYAEIETLSLVNCLFHENFIKTPGGTDREFDGVAVFTKGTEDFVNNFYVTNCTFVDNYHAGGRAGAQLAIDMQTGFSHYWKVVNVLTAWDVESESAEEVGIACKPNLGNCFVDRTCFAPKINSGLYDDQQIMNAFPAGTLDLDEEDDSIFKNWAHGNFQLAEDSVLVDWGTNFVDVDGGPGFRFLPELDLAGQPRIVDGNADGEESVDAGAYECQGESP